ncbi:MULTISPECIES: TIGR01841 family phasin [Pseudomonas]|uniref:Phasin family protein n=1 Tax=Pseudomonas helleri TaxID=1608996 RepID=A0A6L5HSS1_9PSED|nr:MULTISPECIES: TIGR01841 family phasin [Pseudomonas]MQT47877.1 phasin family protein [Pseudomonas helleri]MQT59180.1 phasin family protein [Pseudomonas sp. FSL R10-0399]MQT88754.1 phasin family protein [Pseudomonas helleri]MQU06432.1 phasin family protein [Pseudomonas helleri]
MYLFDIEKLSSAQKSNIDQLQQVAVKLFESTEQLSQLHLKTLRASTETQFENLRLLSSARDPQAFTDWKAILAQPTAQIESALEFNRQVYELVSGTQTEIAKLAEEQVAQGAKQAQEIVEEVAKHAPAGSEPAVAALKSVLKTAGSAYESAQKVAKQVTEMAESNIAAATTASKSRKPAA